MRAVSPKGAARRAEILRVALSVFGTGRGNQASLREVARRCGTTPSGVLYYFGSLEELLVEILRSRDFQKASGPIAVEDFAIQGDLVQDRLAFEYQLQHNMKNPGLVSLFIAMSSHARTPGHPAGTFFSERYDRVRTNLAHYLQTRGAVPRQGLTHAVAASIALAAMDGLQLQWLADETLDMFTAIDGVFTALYELPESTPA
ncbi:TetR/AcrR family transcriptional regulator [Arthrobacter sp. NPDC090010]|uniref:TetR/AcrR family transcriptional regulator n=1 Tax=Arthrobacter sp. NPDC090010 TaxID=3363942 RepID=UPI003825FC58